MKQIRASAAFVLTVLLVPAVLSGCSEKEHEWSEAELSVIECIDDELSVLKDADSGTIEEYLLETDILSDLDRDEIPESVTESCLLFFSYFDYEVTEITFAETTDEEEEPLDATVVLTLTTVDAETLAKDFSRASIVKQLENQASPSVVEYSLEDYYISLQELLTENTYDTVSSDYTVTVQKKTGSWVLVQDSSLEDALVGGFVTYTADPDLFTPEEITALYFDTIKSFDTEQMNQFLSLDELFTGEDDDSKRQTAKAIAAQILVYLDYEILDSSEDGINASVTVSVTSCDWDSIISEYKAEVDSYLDSAQAMEDEQSGRIEKANEILLQKINENTSSDISEVIISLVNDGTNWKLQMDDQFTTAILGNLAEAVSAVSSTIEAEETDDSTGDGTETDSDDETDDTTDDESDVIEAQI